MCSFLLKEIQVFSPWVTPRTTYILYFFFWLIPYFGIHVSIFMLTNNREAILTGTCVKLFILLLTQPPLVDFFSFAYFCVREAVWIPFVFSVQSFQISHPARANLTGLWGRIYGATPSDATKYTALSSKGRHMTCQRLFLNGHINSVTLFAAEVLVGYRSVLVVLLVRVTN